MSREKSKHGALMPNLMETNEEDIFKGTWSSEMLTLRERSIVTVTTLISTGVVDSTLKFNIENAKNAGVTKEEMTEIVTHIAFYAGWPKAWAAFSLVKEVYGE